MVIQTSITKKLEGLETLKILCFIKQYTLIISVEFFFPCRHLSKSIGLGHNFYTFAPILKNSPTYGWRYNNNYEFAVCKLHKCQLHLYNSMKSWCPSVITANKPSGWFQNISISNCIIFINIPIVINSHCVDIIFHWIFIYDNTPTPLS